MAKGIVSASTEFVRTTIGSLIEGLKQIFSGLVMFISGVFTGDWEKAWEGVKEIFKGVWNGIVGALEGAVNFIIKGINFIISALNSISFDFPDWVPGVGGKSFGISIPRIPEAKLPRLATGAVIPPNREFMAILGDQKSGTNIEAPLDTIVEAFNRANRESGGNAQVVALLQALLSAVKAGQTMEVDRRQFGRVVREVYNEESRRVGVNFARG